MKRKSSKTRGGLDPAKYLTPEQLQAVRDHVAARAKELKSKRADTNRLVVEILAGSGVRARELCNIRIQDCPHYHGKPVIYVRDGKGKVSRPVQVHPDLGKLIEEYATAYRQAAGATESLLEGRTGQKMAYGTLRRKIRLLGEEMGLPNRLKPHGFRHSYAVKLYGVETDLLFVAEQLGHKSIQTTTVYAKTLPASARRQVEKMG